MRFGGAIVQFSTGGYMDLIIIIINYQVYMGGYNPFLLNMTELVDSYLHYGNHVFTMTLLTARYAE